MNAGPRQITEAVRRLVHEYRDRCLWFLRADYHPENPEDILRTLNQIERHGDREAHVRAAEIRRWLSRRFSARSSGA